MAIDAVTRLAGTVDVHVPTVSLSQQSHSETMCHPGDNSKSPMVAISTVIPTPDLTVCVCGPPSRHSIPVRSTLTTGVHLGWQVVPSARIEALMQHYQPAGFSEAVSRLAAAPRKPSTNHMYNDRWLRFAYWAVGQGIDSLGPTAAQIATFLYSLFNTHGQSPQTSKGYRTCLASVLNRMGKATVIQDRIISDNMISSMELQRSRIMPVLP